MLLSLIPERTVIPVWTAHDAAMVEPLVEGMAEAGLPVLEITLRSEPALDAIRRAARLGAVTVGAGTVLNADDLRRCRDAGADFAVSPGLSTSLIELAGNLELPYLPGCATVTEIMTAMEAGCGLIKFFPAEIAGGIPMLKQLYQVMPQARFCPTGGVNGSNAAAYLDQPNVHCIGGSWLVPPDAGLRKSGDVSGYLKKQLAEIRPR